MTLSPPQDAATTAAAPATPFTLRVTYKGNVYNMNMKKHRTVAEVISILIQKQVLPDYPEFKP